jgi:hypothetical protein
MAARTPKITFTVTAKQYLAMEAIISDLQAWGMDPWARQQVACLKRSMKQQVERTPPEVQEALQRERDEMAAANEAWEQEVSRHLMADE